MINKSVLLFFLLVYFISVLVHKLNPNAITLVHLWGLGILLSFLVIPYLKKSMISHYIIWGVVIFLSIMNYILYLELNANVLFTTLNIGVAYLILVCSDWRPKITYTLMLSILWVCIAYTIFKVEYHGVSPNDILFNSRNHLTIIMSTFWFTSYILYLKMNDDNSNMRDSLFSFKIALILTSILFSYTLISYTGRTGLFIAATSIFIILFGVLSLSRSKITHFVLLLGTAFLIFYYWIEISFIINESASYQRFIELGGNDVRWSLLANVITDIDALSFILGFPADYTVIEYGLTPHNSFIEIFIATGAIGLIVLIVYFMKSVSLSLKFKPILLFLFISMCFQSFFDSGTFLSPLTGLAFWVTFLYLESIKRKNSIKA